MRVSDQRIQARLTDVAETAAVGRSLEEWAKTYSAESRREMAKRGHALSDGSYPIADAEDLKNAATLAASGHGNVSAAKALIRRRAKELGVKLENLPGFGKEKSETAQLVECPMCHGTGKVPKKTAEKEDND